MNFSYLEDKSVLVASLAAGVLGIGSLIFFLTNYNNDDNLLPALELEVTQLILTKLLERAKLSAVQMLRAVQNIQGQLQQQGQQMTDEEVKKSFILSHFVASIQEAENEILAEYDCDADELEDASRYYATKQKDAKIIELLGRLKRLHKEFGGENDPNEFSVDKGAPALDVSPNIALNALRKLSQLVGEGTDELCEDFIRTYGRPTTQETLMMFQTAMLQMSEKMEAQVLESFGLSQSDFQVALGQGGPEMMKFIQEMQIDNQMRLQKNGIILH